MSKELETMFKNHAPVGKFGITYLDEIFHGILKSDLILIGARTGAGKSTIANHIAYHNAKSGIKVSLFSLENHEFEFELTEIFKECYRHCRMLNTNFRDFKAAVKEYPDDIIKKSTQIVKENNKNIFLVARKPDGFNIEDLKGKFVEHARAGSQMFIIDHIDYFDMHKPRESENQNISEIMREIRKLQDVYHVPVILISHLKKGLKETIVPTLEDFMGTSNKVKEANTVILFAPDDENNTVSTSYIKKTWICVRKDRDLGYFNTVCNIGFDLRTKSYLSEYTLHKVNYWGDKIDGQTKAKTKETKNWQDD